MWVPDNILINYADMNLKQSNSKSDANIGAKSDI